MKIVAFPFINVVQTPLGKLVIKATQTHIHQVYFDDDYTTPINSSPLTQLCSQQITEYFTGTRQLFDLPLSLDGTVFQQQVWNELLHITYGPCISYTELAKKFNDDKRNKTGFIGKFHRWFDWTLGCIAVTDEEIDELYNAVKIGTEIEIKP